MHLLQALRPFILYCTFGLEALQMLDQVLSSVNYSARSLYLLVCLKVNVFGLLLRIKAKCLLSKKSESLLTWITKREKRKEGATFRCYVNLGTFEFLLELFDQLMYSFPLFFVTVFMLSPFPTDLFIIIFGCEGKFWH